MKNPMKKIELKFKLYTKKPDQKSSQPQRGCQIWSIYMYGMPPGRAPSKLHLNLNIELNIFAAVLTVFFASYW